MDGVAFMVGLPSTKRPTFSRTFTPILSRIFIHHRPRTIITVLGVIRGITDVTSTIITTRIIGLIRIITRAQIVIAAVNESFRLD